MANWFPTDRIDEMSDRYRGLYAELALPLIGPLPGAVEAIDAVRESGRAIVITAKNVIHARSHVTSFGFDPADVFGGAWREGKAEVLRAEAATVYVGDHIHDMDAATAAGITGVGVSTGPSPAQALIEHGATEVLTSLTEFPDWLSAR
jgi:phosphoglycolate phosphatase